MRYTVDVPLRDGRYELRSLLGEGSQGQTWEAMDHGSTPRVGPEARARAARAVVDRPLADKWARYVREQNSGGEVPQDARLVAIKCFRVGSAKSWKDVELAEREATTLASLDHPRLPRYFEHFEEDGALYLVMEKIEGESLASMRAQKRSMSAAEVTRMIEDIADALGYLHGRAPYVVHRDVKPGNVIRRPDGSFALVDFGAVRDRLKPAGGSTVVGTFGYMAPEQFQGRASPRSDLYGLGATAITMLTGVEPEDLPHAGLGIDVAKALPSATPPALARTITRMLVPDPDVRIGSVDDVLALLRAGDRTRSERPTATAPATAREREPAPPVRRRRRPLRNVELAAVGSLWLAVYMLTRHGTGHHPLLTTVAIVMAIVVTLSVRAARRRSRVERRDDESRAAAPKVRVAESAPRVRASADEPTSAATDGDTDLDDVESSDTREASRARARLRNR